MIVDHVVITIKAGNGGNGSVSFKSNAQTPKGGPDGGNGGNGGNIYFEGVNDIDALRTFRFKKTIKAEEGVSGSRQNLYGRNGEDTVVLVPLGTHVTDQNTKESIEITQEKTKILIAKGGKGGRGNNEFKSATNQTPLFAEKGEPGQEKLLQLELKLIADIGIIGFPNAGKSTLLSMLTNASPKIGNYAFTTLEPNLGVMPSSAERGPVDRGQPSRRGSVGRDPGGRDIVLADIPGLIEGASGGKGLGTQFLKHIEKTGLLLHCIDSTEKDPLAAYTTILNELTTFSPKLVEKEQIILLTKIDEISADEVKKKVKILQKTKKTVIPLSMYDDVSLKQVRVFLQDTFSLK